MRISRLQIENLRAFDRVEMEAAPGMNVLTGGNGAGKTSVLEALTLLSSGRSFRGGVREALIRRGQGELRVFAEVLSEPEDRRVGVGLARSLRGWAARIDGNAVESLPRLFQELAVVCFEPGSHALMSGGSEHRRRFVDWALFHVEPEFLPAWRRYQRALRQRNAVLKTAGSDADLLPWELEMAQQGARLSTQRRAWLERLIPGLAGMLSGFIAELGAVTPRFMPGWSGGDDAVSLAQALETSRHRDRLLGHSTVGPHRADWALSFEAAPVREMLSRGQEKLVVLSTLLAQAEAFFNVRGQWPILLLDDLPSELDAAHLQRTLDWLSATPAQSFVTATAPPPLSAAPVRASRLFHVEQGKIAPLVY